MFVVIVRTVIGNQYSQWCHPNPNPNLLKMLHPFPTASRKISAPCKVSGPMWRDPPDTKPPCFSNPRLRPFASQDQAALAPGTSPCRPSSSPSQRQQASAQSILRTSSSSAWELVANAHPQAPAGSPGAETLWAGPRWLLSPCKSKKHYSGHVLAAQPQGPPFPAVLLLYWASWPAPRYLRKCGGLTHLDLWCPERRKPRSKSSVNICGLDYWIYILKAA